MKKLEVIYGSQKSFYGKALYSIKLEEFSIIQLISYRTTVFELSRIGNNPPVIKIDGKGRYSRTTDRHIEEFKAQIEHGNFGEYVEKLYREALENK